MLQGISEYKCIQSDRLQSYLHVCMVGWGEGLVYWCRAAPLTAVGVVPFWINDPLAPAELLKVHPHVHLPAERTLLLPLLLCGFLGRSGPGYSPPVLLVLVMPLGPVVAPRPGAGPGRRPLPVQADVLGVLGRVDERGRPLAVRALPGEDHHHDLVGCEVLHRLLLLILLILLLLHLCGVLLLQPAGQHLRHVEHPPGRGGGHQTGTCSQASKEQPVLWTVRAGALVPVGVVDVH